MLIVLLPLVSACLGGPEPELEGLQAADFESFSEQVQPIFDEYCANPSCHGNSGRPLEIYSIHQHRLDPSEVFVDGQLSDQELWLNFQSTRAFVHPKARSEDCQLITKPLAPNAGGVGHTGGAQYYSITEPEVLTLMQWVGRSISMGQD